MTSLLPQFAAHVPLVEEILGYVFDDRQLLQQAFTHRSFANEHADVAERHNERLEFLGDAVLGLIVSEWLYLQFPDRSEGELSKLRARLVEASACSTYVADLHLSPYLLLGRGQRQSEGRGRDSIDADLFEAIIGALYLDGDFGTAKSFFSEKCRAAVDAILEEPAENWKALLQDYAQKETQSPPTYEVEEESGPDHAKHFVVAVSIDGQFLARGEGPSKKTAQQEAAKAAWDAIRQR